MKESLITEDQIKALRDGIDHLKDASGEIIGRAMTTPGAGDAVFRYTNAEFELDLLIGDLEFMDES